MDIRRIAVASILMATTVATTGKGTADETAEAKYIVTVETYDMEAWASYDSVERHEVVTGTDRGAQLYVYREGGHIQRLLLDYGLSRNDVLYSLLYKGGKLVKASKCKREYHSATDGHVAFCQPYPQAEMVKAYFPESGIVCLPSAEESCEAIRSDVTKQQLILKGASDLFLQAATAKPESEVPNIDFLKDF